MKIQLVFWAPTAQPRNRWEDIPGYQERRPKESGVLAVVLVVVAVVVVLATSWCPTVSRKLGGRTFECQEHEPEVYGDVRRG